MSTTAQFHPIPVPLPPHITKDGHVCGITFDDRYGYASCLPCHIITLCLHFFDTNGRVVIPWFGLTVIGSDELSRDALQKFRITSDEETAYKNYVIVKEVHDDSPAKKLELGPGDIVKSHGGCTVSSSLEFLELLHKMFEDFNANYSCVTSVTACDSMREIEVVTFRYGYAEEVILKVKSVEASDKRFFACWPEDGNGLMVPGMGRPGLGLKMTHVSARIYPDVSCTVQPSSES